jgi:hypothetical protein
MKWAGHVAHMGVINNRYNMFFGKLEEKTPVWKSKRRWENNNKDIGWESGFVWLTIGDSGWLL